MSKEIKTKGIMANIANKVNTLDSKSQFNYKNIDLDLLIPNEKNQYGLRDIKELAEDIKELGLLQALLVEPVEDGKYKIIAGHRRHAAVKLLGWQKVECKVRTDLDNIDAEIALHKANNFRELTTSEKAAKIAELERLYKLKKKRGEKVEGKIRDKIGEDMNMSGMQVQRLKNIHYKLIEPLKKLLDEGKITMANASDFSLLNEDQQTIAFNFIVQNINASKEEIKGLKEALKKKDKEKEKIEKEKDSLNEELKRIEIVSKENEDKLREIEEDIENTKDKLKTEIEKDVEIKNSKHIEDLQNKLKKLEEDKKETENEQEEVLMEREKEIEKLKSVIEKSNSTENNKLEEIKVNAEIKISLKNYEKSSSELILNLAKSQNKISLANENIELIKKVKKEYKELEDILNKYI